MKNNRSQQGFTLIELLASTAVILVVGFIIVIIIVSSLRGANKTNTISTTRQNGSYAISQISKLLRFTKSIDAIDGDSSKNCITDTPLPAPQNPESHTSITFTNVDGGVTTIACLVIPDSGGAMTIASESGALSENITGSLLDTDLVYIPAGECELTCNQSTSSDALIVGINFALDTVKPAGTFFSEFSIGAQPLEFNTSVIMRNVGR